MFNPSFRSSTNKYFEIKMLFDLLLMLTKRQLIRPTKLIKTNVLVCFKVSESVQEMRRKLLESH